MGLKLFVIMRRPIPYKAKNIGRWGLILRAISWASVILNAALLTWTFQVFEHGHFGDANPLLHFFISLVILACIKYAVAGLVPDVPSKIKNLEEHHEFVKEELMDAYQKKSMPVSIDELNLKIDDANSGQFRDPRDFAMTRADVQRRVNRIKRLREKQAADGKLDGTGTDLDQAQNKGAIGLAAGVMMGAETM